MDLNERLAAMGTAPCSNEKPVALTPKRVNAVRQALWLLDQEYGHVLDGQYTGFGYFDRASLEEIAEGRSVLQPVAEPCEHAALREAAPVSPAPVDRDYDAWWEGWTPPDRSMTLKETMRAAWDAARSSGAESAATCKCAEQKPRRFPIHHDATCPVWIAREEHIAAGVTSRPVSPLGALPTDEQIKSAYKQYRKTYHSKDEFIDGARWARSFIGTMPSRERP